MKIKLVSAAVAALLSVGAAQAATVTVETQSGFGVFGEAGLRKGVTLRLGNELDGSEYDDTLVAAGQFDLIGNNGFGNFLAYCIQLVQVLDLAADYEAPATLASVGLETGVGIEGSLDALFDTAFDTVDTADEAAAFQLAVWEIAYDSDEGYDLSAGTFGVEANGVVTGLAEGYLAGLGGPILSDYNIKLMQSDDSQNLITAAVPLPAAGLMLLGGLGGLAATRRRKARK